MDIICAGSPCQDLSVAGKREGLKGERSGLFRNAIDIVRRMRNATGGEYPRFFVWENVPGAFNSNKGFDFRAVLEEIGQTEIPMPDKNKWAENGLVQLPGCEIAWRILDAQWWVPQRRKRIFLVADFAKSGRCAGKILFVEPSGGGDTPQGEREGQTVAGSTADGVGDAGEFTDVYNGTITGNVAATLMANSCQTATRCGPTVICNKDAVVLRDRAGKPGGGKGPLLSVEKSLTLQANTNDQVLFESHPNDSRVTGPVEVAPTVSARYGTGGNNTPLVMGCDTYNGAITGETACTLTSASGAPNTSGPKVMVLNDQGGSVMNVEKDKVGTLRAEAHGNNPIVFEPGVATRDGGHIYTDDKAPTLRANPGDNFPTVVYGICSKDSNSMKSANPHSGIYEADKSRTLDTNGANPNCNQGGNVVVYALEGNGARQSHQGKGFSDSGKMYTLNTVENHAVAVCDVASFDGSNITSPINKTTVDFNRPACTLNTDPRSASVVIRTNEPMSTMGGNSIPAGCETDDGQYPCEVYTIPHDERSMCCQPEISDTLTHYVHYVAYSMGHDERSSQFEENKTDPLTASDYKQPPVVAQPMSTTGGAGLHNEQGKLHDELDGRQGADTGGNRLERCSCSCSGKQTVGSLCAHDGRGFNGQDVAQGKLIIEYETDNDG